MERVGNLKISILCSDPAHPITAYLKGWIERHRRFHDIELVQKKSDLTGGDLLFLVSCNQIVSAKDRAFYAASLVLHASDLPKGRGWSPHIWAIASGSDKITLTLLEAEDKVDSGRIWKKVDILVPKDALWHEINDLLFTEEIRMMDFALISRDVIQPQKQSDEVEPTYHRARTPEDSRIDPDKSIADQFDLIRVCDPVRYPAFFYHRGQRYALKLEKLPYEGEIPPKQTQQSAV